MAARRSSTARRIALAFAISIGILTPLFGIGTYLLARQALEGELARRINEELATLLQAEQHEGRAALIGDIRGRDAAVDAEGGYLLVNPSGQRIAGSIRTRTPALGWSNVRFRGDRGEVAHGRALAVRLGDGAILAVVEESSSLLRIERLLLAIVGIAFGLLLAITMGCGLTFGAILHRRLSALDEAAAAIIGGDLARRMPVGPRNDEFDRLAVTLNRMLDRLALLLDNLQHVSDDIAHDLRTPLARLYTTLEAARDAEDGARQAAITTSLGQAQDLLALFGTILRISEVEAAGDPLRCQAVALDQLARDLAEAFGPAAEDDGRSITLDAQPATICGDPSLLAQALSNLLDNALKHTPPGGGLRLASGVDATGSFVAVADQGGGIAAADVDTALRRFGRLDAARATPGHGLGLNLVSAIVTAHGGVLSLEDAAPGLIVRLRFPAAAPSPG